MSSSTAPVRSGSIGGPRDQRFRCLRATPVALATALLLVLGGCASAGEDDTTPGAGAALTDAPVTVPADQPSAVAPEPTATVPTVDPCALVSKAEAERLAGTRLNDPNPVQQTCTYTAPVTGPTAQVEVFVGDGAAKFLSVERDLGHELRPLTGVGDEAYATHEAVFVNKAGLWVAVRLVRLNDPAENRAPLEQAARVVAGRL